MTREFRRGSTPEQRGQLLACLYAVTAADGTISSAESREIANVAEELGFTRAEANALRSQYRDRLAEFQKK
ncbi:MAG: TerB family tellurite resistance protein [Myxococcota bacterium]